TCAMTLARSSGSLGSWASAGIAASSSVAKTLIRYELFTLISLSTSAVLRAGRQDLSVRQRHHPQESRARTVSCAACFGTYCLAKGGLDIALVDVASSEEGRRRSLERPGLHFSFAVLRVDDQLDVRIPPIDFGQSALHADSIIEIIEG